MHHTDPFHSTRLSFKDKEGHRAAIQPAIFSLGSLAWVQKLRGVFYLDRSDVVALRDYLTAWLEATAPDNDTDTPGGTT